MIAWVKSLRLYFIAGAVVLVIASLGYFIHTLKRDAVNEYKMEVIERDLGRIDHATKADEASRRCSADPACRLSNDGFRRD